ncbi:lipopolysaccharide biosynthesis protein [Clostridium botulinum]|uniref:lipopolysaccharide biosynthesis protein n=1 Tax=Clostridium botulinum TaxID=1491 RepID=UPI00217DA5FF|nr:lipopolysaccharide biosynthesis protein [Clostridium botulinum]MCS6104930.1 lipopolysaccharide biosynthesis protein [Clostridium botulinum]MCS6108279.1 lipopolysaccharide biosynthesis protein [Clostridium botulinum]
MKEENIKCKFISATKWSTITEIAAKMVSPITNMILARIITPEAFGVIATVTMIMSFADMFTDAGFQKYLVQHEFKDEDEKFKNANVAFWTNLGISVFILGIIIVFRKSISIMVGNPGLGNVIAIASIQLLLTSFSSIQMALYRRDFNFKTLFLVRIVSVCIPFVLTIPLAFLGLGYWSLIIGSIAIQISNAVLLTIKSKWKPRVFYKFEILKEMLSFSIWSLIEAISIWLTMWIDMFIIGNSLNQYYLGIYKTSTSMVNALMSLITASIIPVFFSAISRLQGNDKEFQKMYFNTQRIASVFVLPLGIGVYLYSDLATKIFLGSKWGEANKVIGIWALTSALMIVFGHFNSEVYRAKGRPKLSFLSQMLHLIVLVPVCIVSSKYGFWILVYSRAWIRMEGIVVGFFIMKIAIGFPIEKVFKNVMPTVISSIAMGALICLLQQISNSILWSFTSIIICSLFYFVVLYLFRSMRKEMNVILEKIKIKLIRQKYVELND